MIDPGISTASPCPTPLAPNTLELELVCPENPNFRISVNSPFGDSCVMLLLLLLLLLLAAG